MHACLFSLVLSLQSGAPSSELRLPSGAHLGVAWKKDQQKDLLREERRARVQDQLVRPRAEIAWLGSWPQEAQARAEELGVDLVVVLCAAKSAGSSPITHEYGNKTGRTARTRFTGAESEIELEFWRRGTEWELRGQKHAERTARAPWTMSAVPGDKQDVVVDPEDQLAALIAASLDDGADFLAGEALWAERATIRARAAGLEVAESSALWLLAREAGPRSAAPQPRATLARAAAADWATWRERIEERASASVADGVCGWCCALSPGAPCGCAESVGFSALIEFTAGILGPTPMEAPGGKPASNPAKGLRGDRPKDALPQFAEIEQGLGLCPGLDAGEAFERLERGGIQWPDAGVHVLVVGEGLGERLTPGLDEDFARPARDLVIHGDASSEVALERWGIREKLPFAALIRREKDDDQKLQLLRVVKAKDLDDTALQGLLEQALWSEYRGK